MLGTIRFCLALCVVVVHLTAPLLNLGPLAVNFFYVISGFLITMVLHETYKFSLLPFATNRFLRLYPAYYAVAIIGLIFTFAFVDHSRFHAAWSNGLTPASVAGNLLIFPWAFAADDLVPVNFLQLDLLHSAALHHRLVPSTWSVGVEIVCYFTLWLFTARRIVFSVITVAISALWQWYVASRGLISQAYFPAPAAMLAFGSGALAYHLAKRFNVSALSTREAAWVSAAVGVLFFANWRVSTLSSLIPSFTYYANTALAFAAVLLINRTRHAGVAWRLDKWLGDLAYPVFLGHYVFGFIAWELLGTDTPTRSWSVFCLGAALTIVVSIVIVRVVDHPLMRYRDRVRTATRNTFTPRPPISTLGSEPI